MLLQLGPRINDLFTRSTTAGLIDPASGGVLKAYHVPPRAKRVIYLFMSGGPSQLDLFDHKPGLNKWDDKPCPDEFIKGKRFAFLRGHPKLGASKFRFARHGKCGAEMSELLPHLHPPP